MTTLRRFLVVQAFAFWQGGFLFYSAVVVPVGTDVLGSARLQGEITQTVTNWLNLIGVGWAVVYLWDVLADRDRRRQRVRLAGWLLAVELLAALALLHLKLDAGLDGDRAVFYRWHAAYLWVSTAHWLDGMLLAWLAVRAWAPTVSPRPLP